LLLLFPYSFQTYLINITSHLQSTTGLDAGHSAFAGRTGATRNIYDYGTNGAGDYCDETNSCPTNNDVDGHGTHCAGSVGSPTLGMSSCANIFGMKVLSDEGTGRTSSTIRAMLKVQIYFSF
jgi:subtilisin family serine protease